MSKTILLPLSTRRKDIEALMVRIIMATNLLIGVLAVSTAGADDAVTLSVDTEASYTPSAVGTILSNRDLALFRSRRQAADKAADQFVRRRLIQFADRDKEELVLLVADQLVGKVRENCCRPDEEQVTCMVRLHAVVRLSDFIDAQLASLQLTEDEAHADYREEMEPGAATPLKPGHLLARAYRLIDREEPRIAIIYLDNLIRRYPMWRELYEVKSMALRMQNNPVEVTAALRKAYGRGKEE